MQACQLAAPGPAAEPKSAALTADLPALGLITGVAALGLLAVVARRPARQPRLVPDEAGPDVLEEAVSEV